VDKFLLNERRDSLKWFFFNSRYLPQERRCKSCFWKVMRPKYRHCCISVIMQPSGYFLRPHLALGANWVWYPCCRTIS